MGSLARQWFTAIRECGDEVREVLHDGMPGGLTLARDVDVCLRADVVASHMNVNSSFKEQGCATLSRLIVEGHRQAHAACEAEARCGGRYSSPWQPDCRGVRGHQEGCAERRLSAETWRIAEVQKGKPYMRRDRSSGATFCGRGVLSEQYAGWKHHRKRSKTLCFAHTSPRLSRFPF